MLTVSNQNMTTLLPFCPQLVDVVVKNFGGFFPELVAARDTLVAVISEEETSFGERGQRRQRQRARQEVVNRRKGQGRRR